MPPQIDYVGKCISATIRQGLSEVMACLALADIPFRLEQTGGWCMVLMVPRPKDNRELGIIVDDGPWWVCERVWNDEIDDFDEIERVRGDRDMCMPAIRKWHRGEV